MMNPDQELELLEAEWPEAIARLQRKAPARLDRAVLENAATLAQLLSRQSARTRREKTNLKNKVLSKPPEKFTEKDDGRQANLRFSVSRNYTPGDSLGEAEPPKIKAPPAASKYLQLLEGQALSDWLQVASSLIERNQADIALLILREAQRRFEDKR